MTESTPVGSTSGTYGLIAAATQYAPLWGPAVGVTPNNTQADAEITTRCPGTLKNLRTAIGTTSATFTTKIGILINSVEVLSITMAAGFQGIAYDAASVAAVANGDLVCARSVTGSGSGTATMGGFSAELQSSGQASRMLTGGRHLGFAQGASTTTYILPCGDWSSAATSASGLPMPESATLSNMQVEVLLAITASTTVNLLKNGVAGNQTITIASGVSGRVEDTTHSDTVVAGDLVLMQVVIGAGSGLLELSNAAVKYTGSTANQAPFFGGQNSGTSSTRCALNASSTAAGGDSLSAFPIPYRGIWSGLSVNALTNASTTTVSVTARDSGGFNRSQVVTFASGVTGTATDSTHADGLSQGAAVSYLAAGMNASFVWTASSLFKANPTPFIPPPRPLRFQLRT